jgi:hypothetical protein
MNTCEDPVPMESVVNGWLLPLNKGASLLITSSDSNFCGIRVWDSHSRSWVWILSGCLSFYFFSSTIDMWDPRVWQIRRCFGPAWNDTSALYAGLCTLDRTWTFGASWGTAVRQVLRLRTVLDITGKFEDCWCISLLNWFGGSMKSGISWSDSAANPPCEV